MVTKVFIAVSLLISSIFVGTAPATAQQQVDRCQTEFADVLRLYVAFFDREFDEKGGLYWQEQFRNGATLEDIAFAMSAGTEFQTRYANIDGDLQFLVEVYRNVFARNPDLSGISYWYTQMNDGLPRYLAVRWMAQSPELAQRFNYEDTCYDVPTRTSEGIRNANSWTFQVPSVPQPLPTNSRCQLTAQNDDSTSAATEITVSYEDGSQRVITRRELFANFKSSDAIGAATAIQVSEGASFEKLFVNCFD